jgi:hypothetical protein
MLSFRRHARLIAAGTLAGSVALAVSVGSAVPAMAAPASPGAPAVTAATGMPPVAQRPAFDVTALTARSWTQTQAVAHRVQAGLHAKQDAARARAAAAAAARKLASHDPRTIAQGMLARYGWKPSQFPYLDKLWFHESGWQVTATNAGSGAYGIPQSLPGSQMSSAGPDWRTNAATQIKWGLTYIQGRYGSPGGAWAHEISHNWY